MGILNTSNRLSLALLLDSLTFSMFIVVFFPFVNSLGGTQLYLGTIMSVMSLVGLVWNPMIGSLGDTYGRKIILIRLSAMCAVSYFLLVIANSLTVIFISRVLTAFSGPLLPIVGTAASELKKEEQSSYYGKLPTVMSLGFILGSLIGGFISELNNGHRLCFLFMMTMSLINVGIFKTLPDTKKETPNSQESLPIIKVAQKELRNIYVKLLNVNWKEYSDIFSVKLCFELGSSIFFRSIGPSFVQFGVRGRAMGVLFTIISFCTIISNIVLARLKKSLYADDKFGSKRFFHAAIMFLSTAVIFSFSNDVYMFTCGFFPMSIGRAIAESTFTEALMAKATEKDKGSISGAFESITSFCGLITPIGAGILNDMYGLKFTFKLSTLPLILGVILTYSQM